MAINLLQLPLLQPKITCSTVSLDGYDVSNLLALSVPRLRSGERGEGFIAETFIKPPVNITITFACNVDIDRVIVDGRIGSQRSTGMELYTASVRRQHLSARPINFDDVIFQCVGRAHLPSEPVNNKSHNLDNNDNGKSNENCIFTFVNKRFRPRLYSDATINVEGEMVTNSEPEAEHNRGVYILNHRLDNHLSAVSAICLRVTRTFNGSAVTVRRIEIWGQVSGLRDATRAKAESVAVANSSSIISRHLASEEFKSNEVNGRASAGTCSSNLTEDEPLLPSNTPLEFLDAVTHEVMTCPLLLPCGQIVDKTTLDRFSKEEANWGRAPSDPFTGKLFTSDNKPIVSDALKSRLDLFILRNADEIWNKSGNRSYVLGRATDVDKTSVSIHSTEGATAAASGSRTGSQSVEVLESPSSPVRKRFKASERRDNRVVDIKRSSDIVCLSSDDSDVESDDDSLRNKSKLNTPKIDVRNFAQDNSTDCIHLSDDDDDDDDCIDLTSDTLAASSVLKTSTIVNHENAITSSLESALRSTLAVLPSFTRAAAQPTVSQRCPAACCKCEGTDTAVLYTLACQHLICRSCLVACMKSGRSKEVEPEKCSSCDVVIATHLATKAHFS